MTTTLSLGGGIVYLKEQYDSGSFEDLGFCTDFSLKISIEEEYVDQYMSDSSNRLIRVPGDSGFVTKVEGTGSFACESITRNLLQKIWFRGTNSSDGTELLQVTDLATVVRALKFMSVPANGPTYCVTLPAVRLEATDAVPLQQYDWVAVKFDFEILIAYGLPTLRVQEEGEELTDFCT